MQTVANPIKPSSGKILDLEWGRITWLVASSLGNSSRLTFGQVTIKPGHENALHRHPNCDEIFHLVRGRIEHTLGDERHVMEPGDTISIPAGAWHQARTLGDEEAGALICFSSADRQTESIGEEG